MHSCDVCKSTFATKEATTQHKKSTRHCVCLHCDKVLASSKGVKAHIDAVHYNKCPQCPATFTEESRLTQHRKSKRHCFCVACNKLFGTVGGFNAHNDALHCHKCPQCPATFTEKRRLTDHQKFKRHCFCGDCNKSFGSVKGFRGHLQSSRHSTEFRCCDCDCEFDSTDALNQHLWDEVHSCPAASTVFWKNTSDIDAAQKLQCIECSRTFATEEALAQHLASLAHHPLGTLPCIASASCHATFSSPSAVFHHLESGACPSGMDRDQIKALIMEHDVDRVITQLPADDGSSVEAGSHRGSLLVCTPSRLSFSSTTDGCLTPTSGSLSDWGMLIAEYSPHRCPFCPRERRPFQDATALRQHVESAAHIKPFIYCPTSMLPGGHGNFKVVRKFNTVSGLAQHLESGACTGGTATVWNAIKAIETRFQALGIQLKLTEGGGN